MLLRFCICFSLFSLVLILYLGGQTDAVSQCQCAQLESCVEERKKAARECSESCKAQLTTSRDAVETCQKEQQSYKNSKKSRGSRGGSKNLQKRFEDLGLCGRQKFQGESKSDTPGSDGLRGRVRGRPPQAKAQPSYLPDDVKIYINCIKQCKQSQNPQAQPESEWLCPDSQTPDSFTDSKKKQRGGALQKVASCAVTKDCCIMLETQRLSTAIQEQKEKKRAQSAGGGGGQSAGGGGPRFSDNNANRPKRRGLCVCLLSELKIDTSVCKSQKSASSGTSSKKLRFARHVLFGLDEEAGLDLDEESIQSNLEELLAEDMN